MSSAAPRAVTVPLPIMGYFPVTFRERGVAIPFTTPQIAGTRVRPGERVALELLVPNPSGGRGVYILPWTDLQGLCRPTLHDLRLIERIAERRAMTPGAIRVAARDVAAEGLAGREAVAAARRATQAEQRCLLETNFEMLLALLHQIEHPARGARMAQDRPASLERRAREAIGIVAPELGLAPAAAARFLEELAAVYVPIGVGRGRSSARVPLVVAALAEMRQEATLWWRTQPDDGGPDAGLLAIMSDLTLSCVRRTLGDAQGLTGDMRALLLRWRASSADVAQQVARSEWLIDGWDRIIEIWRVARTMTRRRDILAEISVLLPVIPREAADWVNVGFDLQEEFLRNRRKTALSEDWRGGTALFDQVARNERLLARTTVIAASGPDDPP